MKTWNIVSLLIFTLYVTPFYAQASTTEPSNIDQHIKNFKEGINSLINPSKQCMESGRMDWLSQNIDLIKNKPNKIIKSEGPFGKPSDQNSGTYKFYTVGMETWSLYNIDDYEHYKKFQQVEQKLKKVLAGFYANKFNYAPKEADQLANNVVNALLSKSLSAFDYAPLTNQYVYHLKKLILEKENINKIYTFNDITQLQNPFDNTKEIKHGTVVGGWHSYPSSTENESLLSIAVDYPQALEHLLKIGIAPNHQNYFGKTPLMYAAQRNQLDSVKTLLKYNADVNLLTSKVGSSYPCAFYTLYQYNVSALHYAARFAEPEVIQALISHGASKSQKSKVRKKYSYGQLIKIEGIPSGTPCEWYKYFNPNKESKTKNLLCNTD
jgi:hypothetical protein